MLVRLTFPVFGVVISDPSVGRYLLKMKIRVGPVRGTGGGGNGGVKGEGDTSALAETNKPTKAYVSAVKSILTHRNRALGVQGSHSDTYCFSGAGACLRSRGASVHPQTTKSGGRRFRFSCLLGF